MRTIQRDIVGAFIFSKDNKILFGKAGVYENMWAVPGGGVDEGETKEQALHREILEETGIDIGNEKIEKIKVRLTGESEKTLRDTGERVLVKMKFYNYRIFIDKPAKKVNIVLADDFSDAQWFPISNLPTMNLTPPSAATLKKLGFMK